MKLGPYDVTAVHAGEFALDGGAMFGIVPQPLWKKRHPPDDRNRIALALRTLLVRGRGKTILVETGVGRKGSAKFEDLFRVRHDRYDLVGGLQAVGVGPEDVTDVVLTHLHFDHAGGATVREGEVVGPAFPKAVYHIQEENWKTAHEPHELERRSYLPENFAPIEAAGLLQLHTGGEEIFDGVEVLPTGGHTRGMQLIRVSGDGKSVLFCADLFPTASHIRILFIMAYDIQPMTIIEEKKEILSRAVSEGWILHFYHDPEVPASRVIRDGDDFAVGDVVLL